MTHLHCYRVGQRLFRFRGTLTEVVKWAEQNFNHARICSNCGLYRELKEWGMVYFVAQEQLAEVLQAEAECVDMLEDEEA